MMWVTLCVAIVSLLMRGCSRRIPDAVLYGVWAPLAIVIGSLGFLMARGFLSMLAETDQGRMTGICGECKAGSLQTLARARPGRAPVWVGSRCRNCGTTYRRVDGRIVGFPAPVPPDHPDPQGIVFEDAAVGPLGITFLEERHRELGAGGEQTKSGPCPDSPG
ncbi:hypothetical protein TA3x_003447 [Tundrisphaera sp. TA3]|uniref:hypothetical protein n=1 Tax=Tundrisphaera sp. TA3 TaxID=3435775 RepID=UPI003EB7E7FF